MSEFKGTKEKWVLLIGYKSCGVSIGNRSTMVFSNDCEEDKSNALLISKAPEMMEMIIELINEFDLHGDENEVIINKAKKIVKEATELN